MALKTSESVRKKISVVIPVYNTCFAHFRTICESILAQKYSDGEYEVVVVDDGSSPENLQAIETFISDKPNFHLLKSGHVGVSEARNIALREVTGDYLYFADSDDYIESNAFQTIKDAFEESSADMIAFNWYTADRDMNKRRLHKSTSKEYEINQSSFVRSLLRGDRFMGYLWNKAFNLNRISKSDLPSFNFSIQICEDKLWLFELAPLLERIRLLPVPLYWYLDNPDSIQRKRNNVFEKENRVYYALQTIVDKSEILADGKYQSWAMEDYFNTLWFGMINWSWKYHSNKNARQENFDLLCSFYSVLKGRTGLQQHIRWKVASFPVVSRLFAGDLKRPNNSSCS